MKKWIVFIFLIAAGQGQAQNIHINESAKVDQLMNEYINRNKAKTDMQGYRIQLIATTERRLMESTKTKFNRQFPYLKSKWIHKSPYYQVQAGAFATKQEALPELGRVKRRFPKAYLIVDRITLEEVLARL